MDEDGGSQRVTLRAACPLPAEVEARRLADLLRSAVRASGLPVAGFHAELVDDREMARLHQRHAGLAGTTDVLTFRHSNEGEAIEAEAALCVDEARRRAAEFEHSVEEELLLYALHGLLHCGGHDDHDPEAYARMHAEEDRILTAIGVGARFGAVSPPAEGKGSSW